LRQGMVVLCAKSTANIGSLAEYFTGLRVVYVWRREEEARVEGARVRHGVRLRMMSAGARVRVS